MTPAQAMAAATLAVIGPDPHAAQHLADLKRAIGMHCAIHGCDNDHRSNGFCDTHYRQHKRATQNWAHDINRKKAS